MRMARGMVVVCALLALPSALLAQKRQRADAGSKDAAKVMVHPIRGGMPRYRAAIGRSNQTVMNVASRITQRVQSGNANIEWTRAQALQIQSSLHFGLNQIAQADAIATPSEKRHLALLRSNDEAALTDANQLVAETQKPKPDPREIGTVVQRIFQKIQVSGKVTATDDWTQ